MNWSSLFNSYARRKIENAESAPLPGYATDVDLTGGRDLTAIGDAWARTLGGPFIVFEHFLL